MNSRTDAADSRESVATVESSLIEDIVVQKRADTQFLTETVGSREDDDFFDVHESDFK